jgi:hypothetical protein
MGCALQALLWLPILLLPALFSGYAIPALLFIGRPAPELEERAPALEKRDNDAAPAKPARNRDE